MNIYITDCDHENLKQEESVFAAAGIHAVLLQCKTEDELIGQCAQADILLNQYAPITRRVMENLPRLKYVMLLRLRNWGSRSAMCRITA